MVRSPSSPLPMSANAKMYQESDDEEDYRKALEDKEKFRSRHGGSRSTSRGVPEAVSPQASRRERSSSKREHSSRREGSRRREGSLRRESSVRKENDQERSVSRRRPSGESAEITYRVPILQRAPSTEHAGDLKAMKDERQRKKEEAARELEERRKSLAQRPQVPSIPHPSDFAPQPTRTGSGDASPMTTPATSSSQTGEPRRSMYARSGSNVHIGLPATPKAMRLILESEGRGIPGVPPIPANFAQRSSPGGSPKATAPSPKGSPRQAPEGNLLTLLPATVYQPPTRPNIPRSMSAPIPDDPHDSPARSGGSRVGSVRQSSRGEIRGIDALIGGGTEPRRGSYDDQAPPAPPPLLKELQHLAMPPPPPPAPLQGLAHHGEAATRTSAGIEIVKDDDESHSAAITVPATDVAVPVISPPVPPQGKGHNRGRSITESTSTGNSLASRISKATERLRSASRSRKESRTKSPIEPAPYESIPYESIPHQQPYLRETVRSPPIVDPGTLPTGLNASELI